MNEVDYHPYAPATRANPYPAYARLRRDAPVHHVASLGFWMVSRYADVLFVLKHPALFSSRVVDPLPGTPRHLSARSVPLLDSDPPAHTQLRRIVNQGFTRARIAALEPRIRAMTERMVDRLLSREQCDLMSELAVPLPVAVIAELLGIAPERRQDFKRWSNAVMIGTGMPTAALPATIAEEITAFHAFCHQLIVERRRDPGDDFISALVHAVDSDTALTASEVVSLSALLLVAGNETTTKLIGSALLALLRHPAELAMVQADPAAVPAAVEETLRYDPPAQFVRRQATQDITLGTVTIPAQALVMPCIGSANRDEEQFAEPDRFDVTRNPQGHLAFGFGAHFCVGAVLARLTATIALEAVVSRLPALALVPDREQDTLSESLFVRGPKRLWVTFGSATEQG